MFVPYRIITLFLSVMSVLTICIKDKIMRTLLSSIITSFVSAHTAQVQIVHNSPSPTVNIYIDGVVALKDVAYRASTDLDDLPINTEVSIASADSELITTGTALATETFENTVPNGFVLLQNFPNPFNPVTSISYQLISASPVAITIYDLMGNVVNNLFSGIEGPGYKSINWDATNNNGDLVSSGMYFYKLQVGESFEIKRMMYLK